MIRSPAEFYIKFLIVSPENYENDAIEKKLEWTGLDFISQEYVDGLRDSLAPPRPFHPRDPLHDKSQRFLYREGLRALFFPDDDMRMAQNVLGKRRAKEFIETMLLSHAPLGAIAMGVTRYRGVGCSPRAIELYRHFYWNVDLLDGPEVRTLLELRYQKLLRSDKPVDKALAAAAKKARDPRQMAAELPFSPLGAMLAQMRMGIVPRDIRVAERVVAARNLAVIRAEECLYASAAKDAANYAITAKIMTELLETVQNPDDQLRAELSTITLRVDSAPVPTLHELTRGLHTVDLQPSADGDVDDEHDSAAPADAAPDPDD
ncbi:hypothetical protein LVJ94_35210 [Pendulispora rubella]|uniref:Uncharacterized protein n=1 Tax=Pendulispora rubella TaxID=2741070 RepID=A0ABZ2KU01_9BACT